MLYNRTSMLRPLRRHIPAFRESLLASDKEH